MGVSSLAGVVRWGKPYRRRGPLRGACLRLAGDERGGATCRGKGLLLSEYGSAPPHLSPGVAWWWSVGGGCTRRPGTSLPDGVQPPGAGQVYRARKNTKGEKPGAALSTTR